MSLLNRKFPTIVGLLLLTAFILGGVYFFKNRSATVSEEVIPLNVRITNVADNKFSVSWTTGVPVEGAVEYGPIGEKLGTIAPDEREVGPYLTHHVTVEGLQPNTQYAFRILSGDMPSRFDNNGSPYTATTGPVIGETPPSQNFYGDVEAMTEESVEGTLVYLTLPGSGTASTIVSDSGSYAFTLSTIRSTDGRSYVKYDPAATIANVVVDSGMEQSNVAVSLANMAPVPTITLGEDGSFLNAGEKPTVAEIGTETDVLPEEPTTPAENIPEQAPILNVEPLAENDINAVSSSTLAILNPATEGETLATLRPEFRGTGPTGTTLTIALTGQKAISDTVTIDTDGTWSWAPVIDLKAGKQTIAVSYIGSGGTPQKLSRGFTASATKITSDPAFVASPSGSTTTTKTATPSATPREAMPATDSGVPVTGVIENTVLTAALGIVIMIVGATLLAF